MNRPVILREHRNGEGKNCKTPNEYHLYNGCYFTGPVRKRSPNIFLNLLIPNTHTMGYIFADTTDLFDQVLPLNDDLLNISREFLTNSRVVSVLQKTVNSRTTKKVCLQNRLSNEVVLLTIVDFVPDERYVKSAMEGWYIYCADMIAPCAFYNDIKQRL